ncbi:MAG TPA: TonB-dependent receptor [Terracidiphilus sp.]|nr:TonB-dependent receptor [Terracidiphilus sp.]
MQKRLTAISAVIGLALLLSLSAKMTLAQAVTGALLGTVQDSSGAVVPNAAVTLTNEGTNVINTTVTGPQGFFTFPNLNPGEYTVTVSASGFKKVISQHNVVQVEKTTSVNLTLQPGAVSTEVTVTGQTPLVETTTSDLGTSISRVQINNLPINGRSPQMLMQLAPGSTPAAWGAGNPEDSSTAATTAPGGGGGGAYTSTNGFPFQSNLYLVDGVSDVELENGYQGLQIPFDFISEMKLETGNPSAEYGTFGGQVSNLTTKSGTNRFHGQLFEFDMNTDFNSPDYFSKKNPPFHQNQFGGEVDGPIIKNKLFFAGDVQWLKRATGSSGITSLPTAAARSGNLSAFVKNGAGPITNPHACYLIAAANGATAPADCTASSAVTVAGTADTVPAADISPIAAAFWSPSVWPLPDGSGAVNNASYVQLNDASMPQEDVRVDWAISQNDRFFARFGYSNRTVTQPLMVGTSATPAKFMNNGNANGTNQSTNDVVGWDHTFGATGTMINQLRLGFSRFATSMFTTAYGISENNTLGVPNGNIGTYAETSGVAAVSISGGFMGTGDPGWVPDTLGRLSNIYQFNDSFSWVKGRNNWMFGFVFEPIQARVFNAQNDPRGQLKAGGNYTGTGSQGAALADWLVGGLTDSNRDHFFDKPNTRTSDIGEFVQDNLRLTQKVTLNLGLRYDIYTHPVDTKNLQSNFIKSGVNGGMIQLASSSNRGPNVNTFYGNVAPRLGVAYSPDSGKTAFHAALGLSYFNENFGANGGTLERNYPELLQENNSAAQNNCNSLYSGPGVYTGAGAALYSQCGSLILANGLPGITTGQVYSPILQPANAKPGALVFSPAGFGVYSVASNFRQSLDTMWNVSIERQLGPEMSFHAAYVGTVGNHLYHDYQLNQCNPVSFNVATPAPAYPQCLPYYTFPQNPNWTPAMNGSISTVDFRNSGGKSHYNAGQFEFERRAGANLTFTAAYTWSKMMDNINNPIDAYATREELDTVGWQRNNFPQSMQVTYVYGLPFGRGKQFASSISPLADDVIGGWTVSGVTWFRSGAPLLMSASSGGLLPHNNGQRANYNCASPVNPHKVSQWFDTSCFSAPSGFVFGNAGVAQGSIYGPRFLSFDMSFAKAVHFTERTKLEFQAQFFNIFNRVNYQPPDTNASDSNFGVINNDFLPRQGELGMTLSF